MREITFAIISIKACHVFLKCHLFLFFNQMFIHDDYELLKILLVLNKTTNCKLERI